MSTIGIIGYGYVGKATAYAFSEYDRECGRQPKHRILFYDKYKPSDDLARVLDESEYIFICLPTPYCEDELQIDLSICDQMIGYMYPHIAGRGKLVVIKSTVIPGTVRQYATAYPNVPFAFNPEFLTEANYLQDAVMPERIVIGADNNWISQKLIDLYRTCFTRTPILRMSATAAEIVKYQCNVVMAAKVAIANVFYDICQAEQVNYEDVKKAVVMDSRIGKSHLDVSSERGFGGKCFPKDLGALLGHCRQLGVDHKLLEEVYAYNLRIRKVCDWREIAGASIGGRQYEEETASLGGMGIAD